MKKISTQIVASLVVALAAMSASATFTPVPTKEEAPLRLVVGVTEGNTFAPAGLQNLGAFGSLVIGVGSGFDVGFRVHGGVNNSSGANTPGLFQTGVVYGGYVGGDVMLRFLGNVTDAFFMGVQASGGYTYMFNRPALPAGRTAASDASLIPVTAGLVFGFTFADAASIYLYPAFELGRKNMTDNGVWGSLYGMSIPLGTWIDLGGTNLVIEAKPRVADVTGFGTAANWGMDATLGLGWDL
jgi:hypothetical protein